ncbi:MAG: flagellar basal-body MS-ring/collar protein FliF [Thermodesulfobacteriota bacterium]|nr:flagellar basal-body MS-ring/collar protein FliF [Thermodesulfobacteriota bacterium]
MTLKDITSRIQSRFISMSMGTRIAAVGLGALSIAVFVVTLMWTLAPDYVYLFTNLTETDASLVVQQLKSDHVPYRLVKGGSAIEVPEEQLYETRLNLASKGLPKGGSGKGFALFDETGFSTSEFVQKINYQRALQNEITQTIMSLDEVDFARVHISLPKESVFIEDELPAKASIVIRLRPGAGISSGRIQGIVYLVAKSVRGLEPENISILDIQGRVLYEGKDQNSAVFMANNQLEVKKSIEKDMQQRAQDLLDRILGPNAAIVKISTDIDMDMVKSSHETFDPEVHVVRSEELQDRYTGNKQNAQGIAGTQSNLPTGRGGAVTGAPGAGEGSSNVIKNYEIGNSRTQRIQSPGRITRLTVSVVVDGIYTTDDQGKRVFTPRSPDELKEIEKSVKTAIGFSRDREDIISVTCMSFAKTGEGLDAFAQETRKREFWTSMIKPAVLVLLVLLLFIFVVRPMIKGISSSIKVIEKEAKDKTEEAIEKTHEAPEEPEAPRIKAAVKSDEMKQAITGQRKIIEDLAKQDTGNATAVVKAWLQEKT